MAARPSPKGTPTATLEPVAVVRVGGQRRWAGLSDRGRVETATPSGHFIQQDRPDLVVAAVRELTGAR
ncbi:MAG: hypothetical protein ACXV4A_03435 [Actinomycetes bacterium]